MRRTALRFALPLLLAACASPPDDNGGRPEYGRAPRSASCDWLGIEVGDCPPDFILLDADGQVFRLSNNLGSPLLVMGSAMWCTSCRSIVQEIEGWLDAESPDLTVVDVLVQDEDGNPADVDDAAAWRDAFDLSFTVLADQDATWAYTWGDPNGLRWIQQSYTLIGSDGVVSWHHNGFDNGALRLIDIQEAVSNVE